jgi:Kef-type K+ transport system membrane component KefB
MIIIFLCLVCGIISGHFLKNKNRVLSHNKTLLMLSIYLLLFLLGLEVGTNQTIISNLTFIGFKALIISLGGILFSVLISSFVYRYFFKNEK